MGEVGLASSDFQVFPPHLLMAVAHIPIDTTTILILLPFSGSVYKAEFIPVISKITLAGVTGLQSLNTGQYINIQTGENHAILLVVPLLKWPKLCVFAALFSIHPSRNYHLATKAGF